MHIDPQDLETIHTLAQSKTFLGREFLTWLWYTAETTREPMRVDWGGTSAASEGDDSGRSKKKNRGLEFDVWVDDRLVLDGSAASAHTHVMKGGDPSHSREASVALTTGKTVSEMKIGLNVKGHGEFFALLNGEDLAPRGLKLPVPRRDDGDDDGASKKRGESEGESPLGLRLRQMAVFLAVLDGLFAKFLAQRTDKSWETEGLADIRAWIRSRQKAQEGGTIH